MGKIYTVGSSNTDMVVQSERLPAPGETVLGGRFIQAHGGKGANQAVAAARLGGDVTFICRVGDDSLGRESIQAYKREGIDTNYLIVDASGASGVALIAVGAGGENLITVAPGVNSNLTPDDLGVLDSELSAGDVVLLQLEIPIEAVEYAARLGHSRGATVILDPAPVPPDGIPPTIFSQLDYILPNQHEAVLLLGREDEPEQLASTIKQLGVRHAIITLGSDGCVFASDLKLETLPAHPVEAVDSTAAGDAFAGALAVALADGYKTKDAISYAQKAAALSVTRMGAQPSLPTHEELNRHFLPDSDPPDF